MKPELPQPGELLVERVARRYMRVTRSDGSYISMLWDPSPLFEHQLIREGIPKEKLEKILDHVWSYFSAYVTMTPKADPVTSSATP